jgi:hypothetical protein
MNEDLQKAVHCFVNTMQELSGDKINTKDMRERKKQAKQHIVNVMKNEKIPFIEVDGKYLVLGDKNVKPSINLEFVVNCYREFHKDPARSNGDISQVSARFGEYLFAFQKHLGERTADLKVSKKPPMCALLMKEFNFTN